MKTLSLFALLSSFLLLLSCSLHAKESCPSEPVNFVAQLYDDYAWEATSENSAPRKRRTLMAQSVRVLQRTFTPDLVQLILKNRQWEARTHDVNMDFVPMWASQDPWAQEITIRSGATPDLVDVSYRSASSRTKIHLSYQLTKKSSAWRIADIHYDKGASLAEILMRSQHPPAPTRASR